MAKTQIKTNSVLSEDVLAEYWFRIRHKAFGNILECFRNSGLKQTDIAQRLNRDPGQISRILKGRQNVTLRTLSDIARAINCRLVVKVEPLDSVRPTNRYLGCETPSPANSRIPSVTTSSPIILMNHA